MSCGGGGGSGGGGPGDAEEEERPWPFAEEEGEEVFREHSYFTIGRNNVLSQAFHSE